jgi:hypothetical protein
VFVEVVDWWGQVIWISPEFSLGVMNGGLNVEAARSWSEKFPEAIGRYAASMEIFALDEAPADFWKKSAANRSGTVRISQRK